MLQIYLDTSVISALHDSRNPERQELTQEFFKKSHLFNLNISEIVITEIENTKEEAHRAGLLSTCSALSILSIDSNCYSLAQLYVEKRVVPDNYFEDALHLAVATINRMDYLMSWNFKHLVKMNTRRMVNFVNSSENYPDLNIITPAELL